MLDSHNADVCNKSINKDYFFTGDGDFKLDTQI